MQCRQTVAGARAGKKKEGVLLGIVNKSILSLGDKLTIRFKPWIGENYENSSFGVRILVLGESHYAEPEDAPGEDWTQHVVRLHGKLLPNGFFTRVAKAVSGFNAADTLTKEARAAFWDNVAYYCYVQDIIGDATKVRPTHTMWEKGKKPFQDVMQLLRPNVVIILGSQLGEWVPVLPSHIEVAWIHHPSCSGFSYFTANPIIRDAIVRARQ